VSRIIYGSRVSLVVGFAAWPSAELWNRLGCGGGFLGGQTDEVIMAVADMQLAFPTILFAIAIIAVLGPSFINLVIVIGIKRLGDLRPHRPWPGPECAREGICRSDQGPGGKSMAYCLAP